MVERRNGAVVRDLTTVETETGNVYVVAPVPASVQTAIQPTGQLKGSVVAKTEPEANRSAPTPRIDGKPDMTGMWQHRRRSKMNDSRAPHHTELYDSR